MDDIEKFEQNDVPLDAKFLQDNSDEIVKIEDPNSVPLSFRFMQLEDENWIFKLYYECKIHHKKLFKN